MGKTKTGGQLVSANFFICYHVLLEEMKAFFRCWQPTVKIGLPWVGPDFCFTCHGSWDSDSDYLRNQQIDETNGTLTGEICNRVKSFDGQFPWEREFLNTHKQNGYQVYEVIVNQC